MAVYFVHSERMGAVKVGTTGNVQARLAALKTASPYPLTLLGSILGDATEERRIHRDLSAYRLEGEWFQDCPTVLAYLKSLCKQPTVQEAFDSDNSLDAEALVGETVLVLPLDDKLPVKEVVLSASTLYLTFKHRGDTITYSAASCVLLTGWPGAKVSVP